MAALFGVPGAAAAELGIELAAEDIPIVVAVGQHVLPLLTTLVSRGLNQSERMERRGEPEPLSRAIVDQGFEIAHFAINDAGGRRILRLRQRDTDEEPRAMAPARPHSRRESVGPPR